MLRLRLVLVLDEVLFAAITHFLTHAAVYFRWYAAAPTGISAVAVRVVVGQHADTHRRGGIIAMDYSQLATFSRNMTAGPSAADKCTLAAVSWHPNSPGATQAVHYHTSPGTR